MNDKLYKGIALFGGMGSGKDTFAEILLEEKENSAIYNIGYICREFMKVSKVNTLWTNKSREFSQLVASKLREIDINILNDYTYAKSLDTDKFPIIVGGRTFEDYEYWKRKGFLIVGIHTDFDLRLKRIKERDSDFNEESLLHKTEKDTDYIACNLCDILVVNNTDLSNLTTEAKNILSLF